MLGSSAGEFAAHQSLREKEDTTQIRRLPRVYWKRILLQVCPVALILARGLRRPQLSSYFDQAIPREAKMHKVSRREFCKTATTIAAAGFLSITERRLFANPLGLPIGSQVYPHQKRIQAGDFAGLLKDMRAIGIQSVELDGPDYPYAAKTMADAKQVKKTLDDHGVISPSAHFMMEALRTRLPEMMDWAKEIGMTQIGTASLHGEMQNGQSTMDGVKRAADEYNKIGAVTAKHGLQLYLHDEV